MSEEARGAVRDARRALDAPARRGRLDGPRLACGVDPDDLVEQVADGHPEARDDHQRGCVYCRAALGEYARLWRSVGTVAAHDPPAPQAAVDEVFRRLRDATEDHDYGQLADPTGRTRISTRAIASLAQELTRAVPGVRVALGQLVDLPDDDGARDLGATLPTGTARLNVTAGVMGGSTAIQIVLAADYGAHLPTLGDRVRTAVADGVRDHLGLEPVYVVVVVDDVLP